MKKKFIFILALFCVFMQGCNNIKEVDINECVDCKIVSDTEYVNIVVNGKDLATNHLCKYNSYSGEAEIPLLSVLRELGAEIKWQGKNKVKVIYNDKTLELSPSKSNFGITVPPGTTGAVRRICGSELIVDDTSSRVIIKAIIDVTITMDYDTLTIYFVQQNEGNCVTSEKTETIESN